MKKSVFARIAAVMLAVILCAVTWAVLASSAALASSAEDTVIGGFDLTLDPADFPAPALGETAKRDVTVLAAMAEGQNFTIPTGMDNSMMWTGVYVDGLIELEYNQIFDVVEYYLRFTAVANDGYTFGGEKEDYKINGVAPVYCSVWGDEISFSYDIFEVLYAFSGIKTVGRGALFLDPSEFPAPSVGGTVQRDIAVLERMLEGQSVSISDVYWATQWGTERFASLTDTEAVFGADTEYYLVLELTADEGCRFGVGMFTVNGERPFGSLRPVSDDRTTYVTEYPLSEVLEGYVTPGSPGDVDRSGKMNATDYTIVRRVVTGTLTVTDELFAACDISGDGNVNAVDYTLLKRAVMGTYIIE